MSTLHRRRFARAGTLGSRAATFNRVAFSAGTAARLSIGFFTWLAAARLYPTSQVGMAASAISALLLCVEVGILGVDAALVAAFPQHRARPAVLLNTAITLATASAACCALGFLVLAATGLRALHFLVAHPANIAVFLLLVTLQTSWWLMDQAAVALHRSVHVPVRAMAAGATTLTGVILLGAVGFDSAGAILLAWAAAALIACLIGLVQLGRACPGYRWRPQLASPLWRTLLAVGLPNFAVTAADIAPGLILPIVAAQQLSPRFAAYWYTVWMMAFAAYSISWSFGLHLFAEIAAAPADLARRSRDTLRSGVLIAGVATIGLIALGPLVLTILGHGYAAHGSGPLRLAALAAIPMVVVKAYLYTCRATRRLREGTLVAFGAGAGAVALAVATAPHFGLTGIAGSWLVAQTLAALWGGLRIRAMTANAELDLEPPAELEERDLPRIAPSGPTLGVVAAKLRAAFPRRLLPVLIPLSIGAVWAVAISQLRLEQMTDLGLISAIPIPALLMLALLTASFAFTITRRPLEPTVALVHVLVLVVMLYGITEFVEAEPRFSSVYRHVGIIGYLLTHGSVKPSIDAYFDWPGFFSLGALVTKLAGWHGAMAFAAWGPLLFNLLYLPPLLAIFSWASDDRRVRWLALWVFYSCNWVGQDYISPQGIAYFLWLAILALLLRWFTPRPTALGPAASVRALWRTFRPRAFRALPSPTASIPLVQTLGVMLLVLLIYGAVVTGHQLTPVPAIIAVTGLVLFAGLQTRGLPVLMVAGLAVWIAFLTTTYLSGHISQLTGGLGGLGGTVTAGVGSRLSGSAAHNLIAQMRVGISGLIWLLAAVGLARRLRAGRADVAILVAGAAPFLLPLLQPYGGEIFLRVFIFALPTTAFFIAAVPFPTPERGRRRLNVAAITVVGCLLLLGFQFTRYGNERMDNFTRSDVAAVQALYRLAPKGSTLEAGNDNLPWRGQGYADYTYLQIDNLSVWQAGHPRAVAVLAQLRHRLAGRGGYVIITRSNEVSAELFEGTPGVLPRLVELLRTAPGVRQLYRSGNADIFFVPGTG